MKKRTTALLCSIALLTGAAVSGSMAWLTSQSSEVINTFTVGDINITLQEHKVNDDGKTLSATVLTDPTKADGNEYRYVPGDILEKDPFVAVKSGSEDCWLFIHVEESEQNTPEGLKSIKAGEAEGKVINYEVNTELWAPVIVNVESNGSTVEMPKPGYYYYSANDATAKAEQNYGILKENQVVVNEHLTKAMAETIKDTTTKPKLIFTAAAVQKSHVNDVTAAWSRLPSDFTGEVQTSGSN